MAIKRLSVGDITKALRTLDAAPVPRTSRMFYKDGVWYKTDRRGRIVGLAGSSLGVRRVLRKKR